MTNTLPKGWIESELGIVCTKPQYGWTSSSNKQGEIKLLRTTDISTPPVNWKDVPFCVKIPEDLEKYLIQINDILVSRAGSIGLSYRITKNDLIENTVFASYLIRFKPLIDPEFVEHYLNSDKYWGYISGFKSGIAVPNVNATKLSNMYFPLPPLAEQKRIAAKLDAVLPRVGKLKGRLIKTQDLIKQFRQSVLNAAITGKLTEEWRKEDNWISKRIGDILIISTGKTPAKKFSHYYGGTKYPFYKPASLDEGINVHHGEEYLTEEGIKHTKLLPVNSVLVTGIGATIGKTGLLKREGACNQQIHAILPSNEIIPKLLYYQIIDRDFQNQITDNSSATTLPIINKTRFEQLILKIPPIEEQQEIVRRIDALFSLADKLEKRLLAITEHVENLGKSVLAKAFRGELVPNEAELAEKECRTYETAEELLVRIKTEKKKLEAERKKQKPTRRRKKMKEEKMNLIDIIKQSPNGITPEKLFKESVYDETQIDKFYNELKSIEMEIEEIKQSFTNESWPKITIKSKKV